MGINNGKIFIDNIEIKKAYLQDEHKKVLYILYNNGITIGKVEKYEFVSDLSQCMTFSNIKREAQLENQIVLTCLVDLESMGFIVNVTKNTNNEYAYGISWLGLKYMELTEEE